MLAFLIVLILAAFVLERLSLNEPLEHVSFDLRSSKRSVDPDEEFFVVSTIANARRLPMPYLRVAEKLPQQVELSLENTSAKYTELRDQVAGNGIYTLSSRIYLMPRQKLTRRVPAHISSRGRYFFYGANIAAGDFLGFRETTRRYDAQSEIVVLPRRADDAEIKQPLGGFLGDMSVRRFIMEDPVLMLGLNEYTGQEPMKSIAWKQSARLHKLMVKRFDHTLEPSVTVVLNVDCGGRQNDGENAALIERCFSLSRTVCETLEQKRIKYGFITNATAAGALGIWSSVTDSLGDGHLYTILEGLGRATYDIAEPFSRTAERAMAMAENGRSHIVITPRRTDETAALALRMERVTGGAVLTLCAGEV